MNLEIKEESFRAFEDILDDRDRQIRIIECELFNSKEEIDHLRMILSEMKNKEEDDIEIINKIQKALEDEKTNNEVRCAKIYNAFKKKDKRIAELETYIKNEEKPPLFKSDENSKIFDRAKNKISALESTLSEIYLELSNLVKRANPDSPLLRSRQPKNSSEIIEALPKLYSKLNSFISKRSKDKESTEVKIDLQNRILFLENRNSKIEDELCNAICNSKLSESKYLSLQKQFKDGEVLLDSISKELCRVKENSSNELAIMGNEISLYKNQIEDLENIISNQNSELNFLKQKNISENSTYEEKVYEAEHWRKKAVELTEEVRIISKEFQGREKTLESEIQEFKKREGNIREKFKKQQFQEIENLRSLSTGKIGDENCGKSGNQNLEFYDQIDQEGMKLYNYLISEVKELKLIINRKEEEISELLNKNTKCKEDLCDYEGKIEDYQNQIETILEEKEVLRLTIKGLEENLANFLENENSESLKKELLSLKTSFQNIKVEKSKVTKLISDNESLQITNEQLKVNIEKTKKKILNLEKQLKDQNELEKENLDNQETIKSLRDACQKNSNVYNDLNEKTNEIKQLKNEIKKLDSLRKEYEFNKISLEEKINAFEMNGKTQGNYIFDKEKEIINLKKAFELSQETLKIVKSKFSKILNSLNQGKQIDKIIEPCYEIAQKDALINQLKKKIICKKNERKGTSNSNTKLMNQSFPNISLLESELHKVKCELENELETSEELRRTENQKSENILSLKKELNSFKDENKFLKNELNELKRLHQNEIEKLVSQIDTIRIEMIKGNNIDDAKSELIEAQRLLKISREELTNKKMKIKELQKVNVELENKNANLLEEVKKCKENEKRNKASLNGFKEADNMRKEVDSHIADKTDLEEKIKRLRTDVQRKDKLLKEIKEKYEETCEKLKESSELEKSLGSFKDSFKKLKTESDRKEEMIKLLKAKLEDVIEEDKTLKATLNEFGAEKSNSTLKETQKIQTLQKNIGKNEKFINLLTDILMKLYRDCLFQSSESQKLRDSKTPKNISRFNESMKILNLTEDEMKVFLSNQSPTQMPSKSLDYFENLLQKKDRLNKEELFDILWKAIENISIAKKEN